MTDWRAVLMTAFLDISPFWCGVRDKKQYTSICPREYQRSVNYTAIIPYVEVTSTFFVDGENGTATAWVSDLHELTKVVDAVNGLCMFTEIRMERDICQTYLTMLKKYNDCMDAASGLARTLGIGAPVLQVADKLVTSGYVPSAAVTLKDDSGLFFSRNDKLIDVNVIFNGVVTHLGSAPVKEVVSKACGALAAHRSSADTALRTFAGESKHREYMEFLDDLIDVTAT